MVVVAPHLALAIFLRSALAHFIGIHALARAFVVEFRCLRAAKPVGRRFFMVWKRLVGLGERSLSENEQDQGDVLESHASTQVHRACRCAVGKSA